MDYKQEKIIGGDGHVAIHDWAPVCTDGHHKDSNEIEMDINDTRHTMDVIFDTLADRLHPRTMVDHFLDKFQLPENRKKVQDVFMNTGRRISESFQENPVPLMLIGIGAAWLFLERRTTSTQTTSGANLQANAKDAYDRTSQGVREKFEDVKDTLSGKTDQAKESLRTGSERVKDELSAKRDELAAKREQGYNWQQQAAGASRKVGSSVSTLIRENPLAVGIAAAMVGMAAGILFPESKMEHRAVGAQAKEAFNDAEERGKEIAGRTKDVVNEAASTAYKKSDEKNIIPEPLKKTEEKSFDAPKNKIVSKENEGYPKK